MGIAANPKHREPRKEGMKKDPIQEQTHGQDPVSISQN